uniref:Uncharacterized protein n=1 Tax=Cucumis sativus TaxID=3659 RepID=A0A0A0KER7_CUCSA
MTKGPHLRRRGRKPPSNMKRERKARLTLPDLKEGNKAPKLGIAKEVKVEKDFFPFNGAPREFLDVPVKSL